MYSFYRVITRNTYDTVKKNVGLLTTDDIIKSSVILFVDDKPHRIIYSKIDVLILEIYPYNYKISDSELLEIQSQIEIILT